MGSGAVTTSMFNALAARVTTLERNLSALAGRVTALEGKTGVDYSGQITALDARLDRLESLTCPNEDRIAALEAKP